MKNKALTKICRAIVNSGIKIRKHAPTIIMTAGAVSVISGAVAACVASSKVPEIMDEHAAEMEIADAEKISDENAAAAAARKVYIHTIGRLIKKYIPAVAAVIVGFFMMFYSHANLCKQNTLIGAQLLAVTQAFNTYRENVKSEIGDREKMMTGDFWDVEDTDTGKLEKYGTEALEKSLKNEYKILLNADTSSIWIKKELDFNVANVEAIRRTLQATGEARGYLFENEVREAFGVKLTKSGYRDGWIFDSDTKIIDFRPTVIRGICKASGICDFYDDNAIVLDLNCDGPILDRLPLSEV